MNNILGILCVFVAPIFWALALDWKFGLAIFLTMFWATCIGTDCVNAIIKAIVVSTNTITSKIK
jgi:hypothetical protein